MNCTAKNRCIVQQLYVLVVRNRSSCVLCGVRQARRSNVNEVKCVVATRPYVWKKRPLPHSSVPATLGFQLGSDVRGKIKLQFRHFSSLATPDSKVEDLNSATSSAALDKLMKPVVEESTWLPENFTTSASRHELDRDRQKIHVEENLNALLDVYVSRDMVEEAQEILLFHHLLGRSEPSAPVLDDTALYNTVLQGWSRTGKWVHLCELFDLMSRDGPKPNLQSYAAALECAGRAAGAEQEIRVQKLLQNIKATGLNIDNINQECRFAADQRELVLRAIRSVHSDFQLTPRKRTDGYINILARGLNSAEETKFFSTWSQRLEQTIKEDGETQLRCELGGKVAIDSLRKGKGHWFSIQEKCEASWRQSLSEEFCNRLANFQKSSTMMGIRGLSLKPFLEVLNHEDYISLMIDEIAYIGLHGYLPSPTELHKMLGAKVMNQYHLQNKRNNGIVKKMQLLYEEYCKYYCDHNLRSQYTPKQYWEELIVKRIDGPDVDYPDKVWPVRIQNEVGLFLYKILKRTKLDTKLVKSDSVKLKRRHVLIFPKVVNLENPDKKSDEFEVNGYLHKLYRHVNEEQLLLYTNSVPMTSPPVPWASCHVGGFLLSSAPFLRVTAMGGEEQVARIKSQSTQKLAPFFDAVNYLSECPWVINKKILDSMLVVFNDGGNQELGIPPRWSPSLRIWRTQPEMSEEEVTAIKNKNAAVRSQRSRMKRLYDKLLQNLAIAVHYRDRVMWFPHTMDFRGRVYPYPRNLSHIEGDTIRSLLLFAEGKPLGTSGLDWLKLHLVNLTGLKKTASFEDRLAFCNEMLSEIEDSANQPLNGRRWWAQAKHPWQTLAACMELTSALQSANQQLYVCHLPVHQDGSSNGLQHYAALGRDSEGAHLVNLTSQDLPQDIYTDIAAAVEETRAKDASDGLEVAQHLQGFINRNVVKETVMTTVNGVVSLNSRRQIVRLLMDECFPSTEAEAAAEYINRQAYTSTRALFEASSEIQHWLMDCADQISQTCSRPVEWETPLGFPVIQPYSIGEKKWNDCNSGDQEDDAQSYMRKKQRRAFPPNYIQCLESTHLMLTALFCQRAGLTFAAVHDSYWTHPSSVDIMNKICREQFVKMHSMPLLESLAEFLTKTYCGTAKDPCNEVTLKSVLCAVPQKGKFDVKEVLSSTYFFS